MLTQLSRLSIESDGRYAKLEELAFIKSYLQSKDLRVSTYQKICASAEEIVSKTEVKMKAMDQKLFINSERDFTDTWKKDIEMLVRYAAAAVLFDDPEHLREGLLLWHHTIAISYKFDKTCNTTFDVMPEVVKEYITEAEAEIFLPLLKLNQVFLT